MPRTNPCQYCTITLALPSIHSSALSSSTPTPTSAPKSIHLSFRALPALLLLMSTLFSLLGSLEHYSPSSLVILIFVPRPPTSLFFFFFFKLSPPPRILPFSPTRPSPD